MKMNERIKNAIISVVSRYHETKSEARVDRERIVCKIVGLFLAR